MTLIRFVVYFLFSYGVVLTATTSPTTPTPRPFINKALKLNTLFYCHLHLFGFSKKNVFIHQGFCQIAECLKWNRCEEYIIIFHYCGRICLSSINVTCLLFKVKAALQLYTFLLALGNNQPGGNQKKNKIQNQRME